MAFTRKDFWDTLNAESAAVGWLIRHRIHYAFDRLDPHGSHWSDDELGVAYIALPPEMGNNLGWQNASELTIDTPEALLEFLAGVRIGAKLMPERLELIRKLEAAKCQVHYKKTELENAQRQLAVLQTLCPCPAADAIAATTQLHLAPMQCGLCDKPRQRPVPTT